MSTKSKQIAENRYPGEETMLIYGKREGFATCHKELVLPLEAEIEAKDALIKELVGVGQKMRERLRYSKCPTCVGTGIMQIGRPNCESKYTSKDVRGRDITVGGGGGAMSMDVSECTTCELLASVNTEWSTALAAAKELNVTPTE